MPQPPSRAARKALLAGNRPVALQAPEGVNRFNDAWDIANQAVGMKQFEVTAPRTEVQAKAPEPIGPISVEYAPPFAIGEEKGEFHPTINPTGLRPFDDAVRAAGVTFIGIG